MSADPSLPENLNELFEKLTPFGPVGTVIQRTFKAAIQPEERILIAYHHLESSEEVGQQKPVMGSCEIKLITSQRFLTLGFFPTYHQIMSHEIHRLASFSLTNRFATGYEGEGDATSAEERGFNPLEIQLEAVFVNEQGETVKEWNQEGSRPEDIKFLYRLLPTLSKMMGKPLAECR
ncbi:hypothetical protein COW36_11770 [bacterium (Candidatus Blackallbacteria) CG17_big_fil_post_rev_8_21_14_2_50_48_46]|uniref:Uncharacterized protein n=1 Tax=bacterium (Candidatus Blackallbacteria) CG17_big_fil_post_rev_8_21_14_2_50_48_46 TaxID=2014261 RepID=A0A2M7G3U4_9BACT|nr:MAG: hypothetical protein COW64_03495 [bacterium (Candidatus Blackallbacteria) CG18_big_fil_WC_8_21_14_2_50_49_26]PIW16441.1 MAG: hypothetical protein COW36_11770 [bacterium (Candidatus Blackallbacteria) CG17_big_fil_post_rev_8_21_14_2_50_48_46]PIW45949.1 MAG: hypothetical protein COW20_17035 [bacterium (Candidatus Blackallbacteria) CG13_big_fil_rev_8_21_14_2_50_49_14]